eukprot:COSAG01_NODE_452_length_16879_cov_474.367223_15_plen_51_part_00
MLLFRSAKIGDIVSTIQYINANGDERAILTTALVAISPSLRPRIEAMHEV